MRHARSLLLIPLIACGSALAQPRYGLAPDAYDAFAKWMTTSCVGEDARAWRETLLRYRAVLAPAFQRALADGPPSEDLQAMRNAADARYAALATFPVAEYRITGLDPQALARLARPSRKAYVDDQVQRYLTGYKSNAIAGLAIVGGPQAQAALARLAATRDDPLAQAAAQALKSLR
ncbi:MAG TPA: hypothetical protein VMN56_18280 [Casimicrobiaceae bacterium]|nr:hypothetical protein [Casimicrobiaceae bacterium]